MLLAMPVGGFADGAMFAIALPACGLFIQWQGCEVPAFGLTQTQRANTQ